MFVCSGRTPFYIGIGDSWWLTLRGVPTWTHISTSAAPGWSSASIFDPVRNRVVAFGGRLTSGTLSSSTWSHSLGTSVAWTQQNVTGTIPSARAGVSGIYDSARDRMVTFGGYGLSGITELHQNDAYAFDMFSNTWDVLTIAGTAPTPRSEHCAIYDPVRDRMVIFGGRNASTASNELWAVDFSPTPQWHLISPTGPVPLARAAAAAVYDPTRDRMIVFGGNGPPMLNDTWALSLSDFSWTQLATGTSPPVRARMGVTLDPVGDRMIVFAGEGVDGGTYDTWSLPLSGTPNWTLLSPGHAGTRSTHSAIHVPAADQMIIFGGFGISPYSGTGIYYNDVLALRLSNNSSWTKLEPTGVPPTARYQHSAIYDPTNNRMLVLGGALSGSTYSDLWSLSLTGTPAWTQLSPSGTSPGQRSGHSAILDPVRNRMLVYGGAADDRV